MHDNLLKAANYIAETKTGHLGPWRLEDAGYPLLKADVINALRTKQPSGSTTVRRKIGEVWIGNDENGGYIATYTTASIEGDCEPLATTDPHRPLPELIQDVTAMIDQLLEAVEHKLTLTVFRLGLNDNQTTYSFTISGREGEYTAYQDGEVLDPQGTPTTPTYADGADASGDLLNLTSAAWQAWEWQAKVCGFDAHLALMSAQVVKAANA